MAQTYTHANLGVLLAKATITFGLVTGIHTVYGLTPETLVWLAFFSGAIAPDIVMIPVFILDKIQGRQPMTKQGPKTMAVKELSHSLPIWWILLCLHLFISIIFRIEGAFLHLGQLFLLSGILAGILPDIPTHSEERFKATDCTYLYPFNERFKKWFGFDTLRWPNDKYEYRIDHGVLWKLKPWELKLNLLIVACSEMLWILQSY